MQVSSENYTFAKYNYRQFVSPKNTKNSMRYFCSGYNIKCVIVLLLLLSLLNGCIPQREIVYLQDKTGQEDYVNPYKELESITNKYILRTNDQLYIYISTTDNRLSEYFNPNRSSSSGNVSQTFSMFTYLIDDNMDIDFPFVGKINLNGCTLSEAKQRVIESLEPFLDDAQITMRIYNSSFVAIGEFGRVGKIDMSKEQITIFEAVALAGDIKSHGKRKEVQITRPMPEGTITYFVDLTDRNIVDSDKYYVYSNDIIYVRPMKAKSWGFGESFSLGAFSSTIGVLSSTLALIFAIQAFKKN